MKKRLIIILSALLSTGALFAEDNQPSAASTQRHTTKSKLDNTDPEKLLLAKLENNERQIIRNISTKGPIAEIYLQMYAGKDLTPTSDKYFISHIRTGKNIQDAEFMHPAEIMAGTPHKTNILHNLEDAGQHAIVHQDYRFNPAGFLELLGPDIHGFKVAHYNFEYLGAEFLGDVNTYVFNVEPKDKNRFRGRFWIDQEGHLVRFTGIFQSGIGEISHSKNVHFDSWRTNIGSDQWVPIASYVEEQIPNDTILHGQIHLWGYGLSAHSKHPGDHVSVSIDNAVDRSDNNEVVDPLVAWREWGKLSSSNVLDRLEQSGLLAPASSFNTILDQIATNIIVPNDLQFSEDVHCRILLTETVEATTVGNTLLLSRGMIETMPNEETIASAIAFELSHLVLRGTANDSRYSFADNTMIRDKDLMHKFRFSHNDEQNTKAAELAVKLLRKSMYGEKLNNIALYYHQMERSSEHLREIYNPQFGDSMLSDAGRPWILPQLQKLPQKMDQKIILQASALPFGSNLIFDVWSDQINLNVAPRPTPQNANERHPFEVMPVYFRLKQSQSSQPSQSDQAEVDATNTSN